MASEEFDNTEPVIGIPSHELSAALELYKSWIPEESRTAMTPEKFLVIRRLAFAINERFREYRKGYDVPNLSLKSSNYFPLSEEITPKTEPSPVETDEPQPIEQ